ncbi:MAG: hypothetical protein EU536_00740, partial [Promethearchaeota archaeon]
MKGFYDGLLGRRSAQSTTPLDARFFWSYKLSRPSPEPASQTDLETSIKVVEEWVETRVRIEYDAIKRDLLQEQTPLPKRTLFERLLTSSSLIHDVFTKLIPRKRNEILERKRILNQLVELAQLVGLAQLKQRVR